MPKYKKLSGKHFYRDENGKLQCVKEGGAITCSPKLLGGSISTFERIKDDEEDVDSEPLPPESEEADRKTEEVPEEIETSKKKVKKKRFEKEAVRPFKRKTDKDN